MTRRPMLIGCLLIVALLLTAPVGSAAPKGKVVIWYDSGAAWNPFIADFSKEIARQVPRRHRGVGDAGCGATLGQAGGRLCDQAGARPRDGLPVPAGAGRAAVQGVGGSVGPGDVGSGAEGDRGSAPEGPRRLLPERAEALGAPAGRAGGGPLRARVLARQGQGQGPRGLERAGRAGGAIHPGRPGRQRAEGHLRVLHLRRARRDQQRRHAVPVQRRRRRHAVPDRRPRREALVQHRRRPRGRQSAPRMAAREESHLAGHPDVHAQGVLRRRPGRQVRHRPRRGVECRAVGEDARWPRTTSSCRTRR